MRIIAAAPQGLIIVTLISQYTLYPIQKKKSGLAMWEYRGTKGYKGSNMMQAL